MRRNLTKHGEICAALLALGFLVRSPDIRAGGKILWKSPVEAQLSLDGRAPKTWNVYQPEKRKNLILVLLGRRYLMLDTKEKSVIEVNAALLKASGAGMESPDPLWGRPIPCSEWNTHDIGPAYLIHVRLGDYGRVLEIKLPHPIDLRAVY